MLSHRHQPEQIFCRDLSKLIVGREREQGIKTKMRVWSPDLFGGPQEVI